MCWNADISLNTFIFSCFVLIFIWITNTYTKYKTPFFTHPVMYLFMFSVVSIQLVEYFLWTNLKNKKANQYYSRIAYLIVLSQPFFIMLMIKDSFLRNVIAGIYGFFVSMYLIIRPYLKNPPTYYTSIAKKGHLVWEWALLKNNPFNDLIIVLMFLCYIIPLLLIENVFARNVILCSMFLSLFVYARDGTFGSMWCWFANILMLYFVINILLIQPFIEYNSLC